MKVFKETQRFNQWWLILLGLVTVIVMGFSFASDLKSVDTFGNEKLISMMFAGVITVAVILLIVFIRLHTKIDENGVSYQFTPFHFKERTIPWSDISKCYVRKYAPIAEYGGWGIRGFQRKGIWNFRNKGMAYNIKGNIGIQLIFKDGGKLLIGTQDPENAKKTIWNYLYKIDQKESFDN